MVAVGRRVESAGSEPESAEHGGEHRADTVPLEVLPSEAAQLVRATTRGSISLPLRPLCQAGRA